MTAPRKKATPKVGDILPPLGPPEGYVEGEPVDGFKTYRKAGSLECLCHYWLVPLLAGFAVGIFAGGILGGPAGAVGVDKYIELGSDGASFTFIHDGTALLVVNEQGTINLEP